MQIFGDGNWVAQWGSAIFHQSVWVQNVEPNKASALTDVSSSQSRDAMLYK